MNVLTESPMLFGLNFVIMGCLLRRNPPIACNSHAGLFCQATTLTICVPLR
jgi:hypothetical protein